MDKGNRPLHARLLGRFEVICEGVTIAQEDWPERKVQTLLKVLLSEPGRVFPQDQLADWLYPDSDLEVRGKGVQRRISELRRLLEPTLKQGKYSKYILRTGQGYCLNTETAYWIDFVEFECRLASAQRLQRVKDWLGALGNYTEALALYRGDYLEEDPYEEWCQEKRRRLQGSLLEGLQGAASCHAELGQYRRAIRYCQRVVELSPVNELIYRQKMLYHYFLKEQAQALETYQACVTALNVHIKTEPTAETRALHEQILNRTISIPDVKPSYAHNLPVQITSFIGREHDIEMVKQQLHHSRLVTLTGIGGVGKTRLALQVAEHLVGDYPDGVWFVELAPARHSSQVLSVIAEVLSVTTGAGKAKLDSLKEWLNKKQLLLILDNCEHVLETCAQGISELLKGCPHLRILTTSREALDITGEAMWAVSPLALPEGFPSLQRLWGNDAIRLFVKRAQAARPTFQLTQDNAETVVAICRRLDGIPLSLELAGARLNIMSPQQLLERLEDRFSLLTRGGRATLPHQEALRATLDWSYDLLTEPEKDLFRRLSVFRGAFGLEAVEGVCTGGMLDVRSVVEHLSDLARKSMVEIHAQGQELRYRLLQTVKQYAEERLITTGDAEAYRKAHSQYFLKAAEKADSMLTRSDQVQWLKLLEQDHENLLAALEWTISANEGEAALRLAGAMGRFWWVQGYLAEGRAWLQQALEAGKRASKGVRAKALRWSGSLAWNQGEHTEARLLLEESMAIYRELGDKEGMAHVLNTLGLEAQDKGKPEEARKLYEESLALFNELGEKRGIAVILGNLGIVSHAQGDNAHAKELYEKSLALYRELEDKGGMASTLVNLGLMAQAEGKHKVARELQEESLVIRRELGDKWGLAHALSGLANLMCLEKEHKQAACLQGAVVTLLETIGATLDPLDHAFYEKSAMALQKALGEDGYCQALKAGQRLKLEEAILLAVGRKTIDHEH